MNRNRTQNWSPAQEQRLVDRLVEALREPIGSHMTDFEVVDYVADRLLHAERVRIEQHVARCADCTNDLVALLEVWTPDSSFKSTSIDMSTAAPQPDSQSRGFLRALANLFTASPDRLALQHLGNGKRDADTPNVVGDEDKKDHGEG